MRIYYIYSKPPDNKDKSFVFKCKILSHKTKLLPNKVVG